LADLEEDFDGDVRDGNAVWARRISWVIPLRIFSEYPGWWVS
jgi:hypothetical protein